MTTFADTLVDGGLNLGVHPWRDFTNPQFAYQLRYTNADDQNSIELVQINVVTGVVSQQGDVWSYPSLGALGACFTSDNINFNSNITGSATGDKLYVTGYARTGGGPNNYDSVIIEFDKTALTVSGHKVTGSHESQPRDGKTSVMNGDGTLFARGSDNFSHVSGSDTVFDHSNIELYRPSNGDYGYINLSSALGITSAVGPDYGYVSPLTFDDTGHLWFIAQPVTVNGTHTNFLLTGASTLYKCSINGSPVLALTVVNSWPIADDYYAYAAGSGGSYTFAESFGYQKMSFNTTTKKLNLWSAWWSRTATDFDEGWYLEFDTVGETFTRGPLSWTPGRPTGNQSRFDAIGWDNGDLLVSYVYNSGEGVDDAFSVFRTSTGVETTYGLLADWGFETDLHLSTFMISDGSFEIYAFDVDFTFPLITPPFTVYRDGLFTAVDDVSVSIDIGGTNFMLDCDGFDVKLLPHILAKTHTGSELEIGPFRYPKQEHADETSTVDSLLVDVSESKNGEPVITNDWLEEDEDDFDEDWNDSPLPEDDTDDWGLIPGLPDLFDTELMSTDDGMSPQFQGVEILTAVEEFNASRKYEPVGFSAIMHRLKFKTSAVGHKFYIKVIDIAGLLTGRHK